MKYNKDIFITNLIKSQGQALRFNGALWLNLDIGLGLELRHMLRLWFRLRYWSFFHTLELDPGALTLYLELRA